jgi:SAM-dependent methyltransferase
MDAKKAVAEFWGEASCGEAQYLPELTIDGYNFEAAERYRLEPEILDFAEFHKWRNKNVLEIGVGLGADHQRFAEDGANLTGIDLTNRAIERVRRRFQLLGLNSQLQTGDAERLPFPDNSFDLVYSWGVIHHTPDTPKAAREILRVLKPGGTFKVMIYNKYSLIGLMLLLRHGFKCGFSLDEVYSRYLESPGTKAYTPAAAKLLFPGAMDVETQIVLTHGDLLTSEAGQRHQGLALKIARKVWPRNLIKVFAKNNGLFLLISGRKNLSLSAHNSAIIMRSGI